MPPRKKKKVVGTPKPGYATKARGSQPGTKKPPDDKPSKIAPSGTRRRYSDEERANALVCVNANGGNMLATSEQLGIPLGTLAKWVYGRYLHPDVIKLQKEIERPLADRIEDVAHQLLGDLLDPVKRSTASLKDSSVALAIAVDKMRLLRGEATTITKREENPEELRLSLAERFERLAARLRQQNQMEGTPPEQLSVVTDNPPADQ